MHTRLYRWLWALPILTLTACAAEPGASPSADREPRPARSDQSEPSQPEGVVAYINGQPLDPARLARPLYEMAGGQALADLVLDAQLRTVLAERELAVTPEAIEAERQRLLASLHDDANQAQRLLDQLKRQRGLGEHRFAQLLWRNAALRALVADDVAVTEEQVRTAYELRHGERYRVRSITTQTLAEASELRRRARAGEAFVDLATQHSLADQPGAIQTISRADPTVPAAVRKTVAGLQPGQVSDPVAMERGFVLIELVQKKAADAVEFADVAQGLRQAVRARSERMAMQQRAQQLLRDARVVVLDPALGKAWESQREVFVSPEF